MIRINQLKMPLEHTMEELTAKAAKSLRLKESQIASIEIAKRSVDARKKPLISFSYVVDVALSGGAAQEQKVVHKVKDRNISLHTQTEYACPIPGTQAMEHAPVVVGAGPAGLIVLDYAYRFVE